MAKPKILQKIDNLFYKIGNLSKLNTSEKNDLVGSINEVDTKINTHLAEKVHLAEVHGLRVNPSTNRFEYYNGTDWEEVEVNAEDIRDNPDLHLRVQVSDTPPATVDGRIYYNPTDDIFYVARNGQWYRLYVAGDEKLEQDPPTQPPQLESRTDTSIKLVADPDMEYMYDGGDWQESSLFTGLNRNTTYTFYGRYKETEIYKASPPSPPAQYTTDKGTQSPPNPPAVINIDYDRATVVGGNGTEVSLNANGPWFDSPHTFVGLQEKTTYTAYARMKETQTHYASEPSQGTQFTTPAEQKIYGVSIDLTNSNPETAVTYTDDAVGMTAGSSAWDSMAIFKDIKPCVLKNGVVQYYLDPNDFTKKADGTPADIESGNDGDVMIEIPKIGFLISTVGNILTVKVTDDPNNPNFKYYAHTRKTEGDRSKLYIGAYLGWKDGSNKLRSLSGKTPTANQTIGTFRTQAKANGSGYDLVSFYPLTLLQCLYLIKYKNLDSQSALGRGYVDGNSATNTGGTNQKGMFFGETTGKQQMKFLGIEDFWGNLRWWIDGLYSDGNRNIMTAFQGFNDNGNNYTNRGRGATSNINGYMSKPQGSDAAGFVLKEANGSETTYFADYAGLNDSCLPIFGGHWNDASDAGAFYLRVNYSASASFSYLGGRLMYL